MAIAQGVCGRSDDSAQCRGPRTEEPTIHNFAYLDEQTKRDPPRHPQGDRDPGYRCSRQREMPSPMIGASARGVQGRRAISGRTMS